MGYKWAWWIGRLAGRVVLAPLVPASMWWLEAKWAWRSFVAGFWGQPWE